MEWLANNGMRTSALWAGVLLATLAGAPSAGAANPRLASLQIEIWPEYDRPHALVILKGELALSGASPAVVALRIPASSGGPSAVAYADSSGKLFNLPYEREEAGDLLILRLRPPQRFFHVEFYDPIGSHRPEREYRYTWPGDLAVERLAILVKEPAAAREFSVQPPLDMTASAADGLNYRGAELGALPSGKHLPIHIRYTKTDPRTSAEILSTASAPRTQAAGSTDGWLIALAAGVLLLWTGAGFVWWRRAKRTVDPSQVRRGGR